jgi:hypothetical protein
MSSWLQHQIDKLKPELQPAYQEAIKAGQAAIDAAFSHIEGQLTGPDASGTGTITDAALKGALYKAIQGANLPILVSGPLTVIVMTLDLSKYEGQGTERLEKIRKDLDCHASKAHL